MATSASGICNLALLRLGHDREISSLDEASAEAGHCKTFYDHVRKTLLRMREWQFAQRISALALLRSGNADFEYAYKIPSGCIRALKIINPYGRDEDVPFRIRGSEIHTDLDDARLLYIYDEQDPNSFDKLFVEAFAYRLASEIAGPITQDINKSKQMYEMFRMTLAQASSIDNAESQIVSGLNLVESRR